MTANNGSSVPGAGIIPRGPANDVQGNNQAVMSEENQRVLEWIAQLMKANTRETALLELSKKREQVPELALILWHSFGRPHSRVTNEHIISVYRCHGFSPPGDHLRLSAPQPVAIDRSGLESRL
jgi:CCR4-NOT transcription complex subunit 9